MKKNYSMKNLRKQAIVEELGDEEITKKGEFDDKTEQITLVTKMLVSTAGPGVGESEELGDEEYNKPGEVDDNSRVYIQGVKNISMGGVLTKLAKLRFIGKGRNH